MYLVEPNLGTYYQFAEETGAPGPCRVGQLDERLRTELYGMLYAEPIYPKNLYLKRAPMKRKEYREKVIQRQIRLMHDRGIWAKPAR